MKMNIVLVIAALLVLFFLFSKKSASYKTVPPRVEDKNVEIASVADMALTGGACGIRPTLI